MLGNYRADECFALEVTDYGFYPRILPGDTVIVHRQPDVESGELAVVMIDSDTNTVLRRIKIDADGGMILTADNPILKMTQSKRYEPIVISAAERYRVHVFGKVISLMRDMTSDAVKRDFENAMTADDVNE